MMAVIRTKQNFWTAYDRPEWCAGWEFTCKMKAVGTVVFGVNAITQAMNVPIGVPLPLCERHYRELEAIGKESPIPVYNNLLRYKE